MNKKTTIFLPLLLIVALSVQAVDQVTVTSSEKCNYTHLKFQKHFSLAGQYCNYNISIQQTINTKGRPSIMQFIHNYPIPSLFELNVNGISSRVIQITPENVRKWSDAKTGAGGCEFTLNFNGAKISARIFMKPSSSLLFIRLAPSGDSLESIRKITFSNYACPNLTKDAKIRWLASSYSREAQTSQRLLKDGKTDLLQGEHSLILYDRNHGRNPAYMTFTPETVQKGTLHQGPYQKLFLDLKPDFKEFTYAFYCSPAKEISNQDIKDLIQKHPERYQITGTSR